MALERDYSSEVLDLFEEAQGYGEDRRSPEYNDAAVHVGLERAQPKGAPWSKRAQRAVLLSLLNADP